MANLEIHSVAIYGTGQYHTEKRNNPYANS
jgi:hypothetical protein